MISDFYHQIFALLPYPNEKRGLWNCLHLSIHGFICKNYFLQVLQEETMSPSYILCQDLVEEVVNAFATECQELGVQVPE